MKRWIPAFAFLLSVFGTNPANAQISFNWNEFFKQKKTQKKYLVSQIAQLQLYIGVLKQGYSIAESGLKTIHAVRNGEFSLHDIFYSDLLRINPAILRLPAAVNTVNYSHVIYRNAQHFRHQVLQEPSLSPQQRGFLERTCNNLIADVDRNIELLQQVLSPQALQLSDMERIQRMEEIQVKSLRQLRFSKVFFSDARLIALGKRSEKVEAEVLGNLYHIKE